MSELHALPSSNVIPLPAVHSEPSDLPPAHHDRDGLPSGYDLRSDGIWHERADRAGDAETVWLCAPIRVMGHVRRPDGTGWGRLVEFEDPDGRMHQEVIDAATLTGTPSKLLEPLLRKGLVIARGAKVRTEIAELLQAWRPAQLFLLADVLGWTDDSCSAFVLGDGRVVGDAAVFYQNATRELADIARPRGTLEDWRREVAAPCLGNPLAMLALCQAFSGPLLQPLGLEGGGFHLHGASSCGKSTLLGAGASVWGARELVRSWRTTDNALEPMAASANATLLALDELYQMNPVKLGDVLYMLGNGRGKARMGHATDQAPVLNWKVAVLSSGEIAVEDNVAASGKKVHAGDRIRLVDIAADCRAYGAFDSLHGAGNGRAFAERLARAAAENCGVAGPEFVKAFIQNPGREKAMLAVIAGFCNRASILNDLTDDPQLQRVVKRFAVAALAGEMASRWQITDWPKSAAYNAMLELVGTWFGDQNRARQTEIEAALDRTRVYLNANTAANLADLAATAPCGADGWRDANCFYLLPDVWRRIHGHDKDAVEAARLHQSAGLLMTQKDGLQYRMPRSVPCQPKVYAVFRRILGVP